jgi:Ion channel
MEHEVLSIMVLLVMLGLLVLVGVLLFRTFRLLYEGERAPKASLLVGYLATAYGLLIFAFAGVYRVIFHYNRESFFFSNNMPAFDNSDVTLFYFSITTITTTGYGDIHPQSEIAMAVAMVEMLSGYFMTVIFFSVIAGLAFKKAGRNE